MQPNRAAINPSSNGTFLALASERVTERFTRITGLHARAVPLDLRRLEDAEDPPENPSRLACAEFAQTDYCRESWQLHLAELTHRPEAHWHKCNHGRLCAVVPVVCQERCLGAVICVNPDTMAEESFERNLELLDVLVENLVSNEGDSLARMHAAEQPVGELETASADFESTAAAEHPTHPKILRALEYTRSHLSDPRLTVRHVASVLEVHPDYLAHLFSVEVGQRMSKYIAARRVELARTLLTTTDWQIKRIARETGHANPNWFSHVFRVHTGLTPGEYRRKVLSGQQINSSRER